MANENLQDRIYKTSDPYDSNDVPRFGQLTETAKDVFKKELTNFFSYGTSDASFKIDELPNIEKYAIGTSSDLESLINVIMSYGDTLDKFPMVAITSSTAKEKRLGIGSNYVTSVQYAPSVVGTNPGPFNLEDGWYITFTTWPDGTVSSATTSTMMISSSSFSDPTNVSASELAAFVNATQALYYNLGVTNSDCIRISTGGPAGTSTPNYIEITGGTTEFLSALGFTVGDSDTYLSTDNYVKNRYAICQEMDINIDVIGDSLNTKTEVADLISDFFMFYMEKRFFQFLGRSYQDREQDPEEWFHIILQNKFRWSSEVSKPRPGEGGYQYLYIDRGTIPITIIDYLDRKIVDEPRFLLPENVQWDSTTPDGDYFSTNYKRHY